MKQKALGIVKNSMLSIMALVLMNAVLQLGVYPFLSRRLGVAVFGDVLVVLAVIAIISAAAGQAVNNARIVAQQKYDCSNGDANITLAVLLAPGAAVAAWYFHRMIPNPGALLLALLLLVLTAVKYYSDVQYRLTLNYNQYFLYYASISLGYVIGIASFYLFHSWIVTMLLGEAGGFLFVVLTGTIYREPFRRTENFRLFFRDSLVLFLSYLLYDAVLHLDRVLLKYLIDSETVAIFYVASLIGKTLALLVGPLNSIAISYLCKRDEALSRRSFAVMIGAGLLLSAVFYAATYIVTPIFARIAYPEIAAEVARYSPMANLSQIVCFLCSFLLVVVLTLAKNRWQIIIQSVYAVSFIVLCLVFSRLWGFEGFILGVLVTNLIRLVFTVVVGMVFAGRKENHRETETT